jgi:hypothetical protein
MPRKSTVLPESPQPGESLRAVTKEHWETYSKELKDEFVPKPRTRHLRQFWHKDGDTWIEIKVFTGRVKKSNKEPVFRSLFYSCKKRIAYWDEPPTGAERVIWLNKNHRGCLPPVPEEGPQEV